MEGTKKRYPGRVSKVNKQLKYYSITLACVCDGRKYSRQCSDNSENAPLRNVVSVPFELLQYNICDILFLNSVLRQNCEAAIKVGLSEDGQYLEILSMTDYHNHEVSEVNSVFATVMCTAFL